MEKVEKLIETCKNLNLKYVGIRGNTSGPFCFIGEAPGEEEHREGLPFVGYSGKFLNMMTEAAGINQEDCWFTNVYKLKPPDTVHKNNDISEIGNLGVPLEMFHEALLEELEFYKPPIIIACGRIALSILCPTELARTSGKFRDRRDDEYAYSKSNKITTEGFGKWRGSLLEAHPYGETSSMSFSNYVIPMYHPAFVLRNYKEKELSVLCLAKAKDEIDTAHRGADGRWYLTPLPQRQIIVSGYDCKDICHYIDDCIDSKSSVSIDIEVSGWKRGLQYPTLIAVARNPNDVISFGFWEFEDYEIREIFRRLDKLMNSNKIIGQNFTSYDAHWLRALGFNVNVNNVDDTMIRHHVLWPDLPHKLEFQTFQYTREPYYKDEGRSFGPKGQRTMENYKRYNARDAAVTYEIFLRQEEEFAER